MVLKKGYHSLVEYKSRRKGTGLLITTLVVAALSSAVALTTVKITQNIYGNVNANSISTQAEQYALGKAAILRGTSYSNLSNENKTNIANSNGYQSEVTLSSETEVSDGIKQKLATIKIYRSGEILPRAKLVVPLTNIEQQSSGGFPVGAIIPWPGSTAPTVGGTWLLCNGGTFSSGTYSELYSVLGKTTLPSLDGRFLQGTTGTPGGTKEAGLPNITATGMKVHVEIWRPARYSEGNHNDGAILKGQSHGEKSLTGSNKDNSTAHPWGWNFDASYSNSIYGASTTVQPKSYLVKYYIKAKD